MITQGSGSSDVGSWMGKGQQNADESAHPSKGEELLQDINTSLVFRNSTKENGLPTQVDGTNDRDSKDIGLLGIVESHSPELGKHDSFIVIEESLEFDNRSYNREVDTATQKDTQEIEEIYSQGVGSETLNEAISKDGHCFDLVKHKRDSGVHNQARDELPTQKIEDNSRATLCPNVTQLSLRESYFDHENKHNYIHDTQRVSQPVDIGFDQMKEGDHRGLYTSPLNNAVQIPCTAEKPKVPRRQVISTQQEINEESPSLRKIDASEGNPGVSESDQEEICSDGEDTYEKHSGLDAEFFDEQTTRVGDTALLRKCQSACGVRRYRHFLRSPESDRILLHVHRRRTKEGIDKLRNRYRPCSGMSRDFVAIGKGSPQEEHLYEVTDGGQENGNSSFICLNEKYANSCFSSSPIKNIPQGCSGSIPDVKERMSFTSTPVSKNSGLGESVSGTPTNGTPIHREETLKCVEETQIKSCKSVWTLIEFNMYPGHIFELHSQELLISFEEGTFPAKTSDLYPLDVRINDILKLQSSRFKYIVTGLLYRKGGGKVTCVRGFNRVILRRYSKAKHRQFEEFEVSMSKCFMELSDWFRRQSQLELCLKTHDLLKVNPVKSFLKSESRKDALTESLRPFAIGKRESNDSVNLIYSLLGNGVVMDEKDSKSTKNFKKSHLFCGMLFFVTFGKNIDDIRRNDLRTLIDDNGGILIDGLPSDILDIGEDEEGNLALSAPSLRRFVFGAVLSNEHCRSAKYLQALALGWPILSETYIFDCIEDNSKLDKWPTYILPAGKSQVLNTLKSLDVFIFRKNHENGKTLSQQLSNNKGLLKDANILILNSSSRSKTVTTCQFIFHAFGAKSLTYLNSYEDVMKNLIGGEKYFLYVDGGSLVQTEEQLSTRRNILLSNKKKKRLDNSGKQQNNFKAEVSLIDWEWVVQCTISNFIWKPKYILIS